jgi:hypothetical protein
MNECLLAKWRWRLLDGEKALWKDVLEDKYDPCKDRVLDGGATSWARFSSVWWKELVKLDDLGGLGWFNGEILRKVGNDANTSFWNVNWHGGGSFVSKYPRLFSISSQKEAKVEDIRGAGENWNFLWRRRLCVGGRVAS